ncbi:MAG: OB-fold nucleic acid binding domain-containing protein [Candidatus Bathyarchaeota archaeon]|nr:OB-fold nucleic acid binding domain-containing protein [Candidatus Bathyarchaeota archaeon]
MTPEDLIQQILSKHTQTSRDQLLQKLDVARAKTGGLIADTTLLRMIARELGVDVSQEPPKPNNNFPLSKLVPGLNNVTVTARVIAVSNVHTFEGAKPGKFASVTLIDHDTVTRAVLWNEKADMIETGKLKSGQIARFSHCYTKEDHDGNVELHLSGKSHIEPDPPDVNDEDYPLFLDTHTEKICNVAANKHVALKGTVKQVLSKSVFTRQDQTEGTALRFKLADSTGEIVVVAWNEKAQELEPLLKPNADVHLIHGRVKNGSNGETEVHLDRDTRVDITHPKPQFTKLANLEELLGSVNVEAEVASLPITKEVKTTQGEKVGLTTLDLKDETGTIRFTAWRQHSQTTKDLLVGEKVCLLNVFVRKGLDGKKELSTKNSTEIIRR